MPLRTKIETLVTSIVDGSTLTAAARASALPAGALFTLPPNFFDTVGKQLMIKATGRQSLAVTTPGTIRWDVNFLDSAAGNAIVADSLAITPGTAGFTTIAFELEWLLTCRAIGATGNLFQQGRFISLVMGATSPPAFPYSGAPAVGANFNTTLSQQVDLRYTPSLATASMILHQYSLVAMN